MDLITFFQGYVERDWSKYDAFVLMNVADAKIADTVQVLGGVNIFRKTAETLRFLGEWMTYSSDPRIITDNKSVFGRNAWLKENRHDQTIFSLLAKKWNLTVWPNPSKAWKGQAMVMKHQTTGLYYPSHNPIDFKLLKNHPVQPFLLDCKWYMDFC